LRRGAAGGNLNASRHAATAAAAANLAWLLLRPMAVICPTWRKMIKVSQRIKFKSSIPAGNTTKTLSLIKYRIPFVRDSAQGVAPDLRRKSWNPF